MKRSTFLTSLLGFVGLGFLVPTPNALPDETLLGTMTFGGQRLEIRLKYTKIPTKNLIAIGRSNDMYMKDGVLWVLRNEKVSL